MTAYSIKNHEVDRLLNVLVLLGWELKEEKYDDTGITLTIRRDLSPELLATAAAVEKSILPK